MKKKEEEEGKKDEKLKINIKEKIAIKKLSDYLSKVVDSTNDLFDINDSLQNILIARKVSKNTQDEIFKIGIETLEQFVIFTVDELVKDWDEPLFKLTAKDKTILNHIKNIVDNQIEEKEVY